MTASSSDSMSSKLIYIGGYGRSGSTVLDIYLGSTAHGFSLGEAAYLFDEHALDHPCRCGEPLVACQFWGGFLEGGAEASRVNRQMRLVDILGSCIASRGAVREYEAFWGEVIGSLSPEHIVVDSSKTSRLTFRRVHNLTHLADVTLIYLWRSPSQLIHSWIKGRNSGLSSGRTQRPAVYRSFLGWMLATAVVCVQARRLDSVLVVRYEDFCEDPTRLLESLTEIGVNLGPSQQLTPGHGVAGNRAAPKIRKVELRVDAAPVPRRYSPALAAMTAMQRIALKIAGSAQR